MLIRFALPDDAEPASQLTLNIFNDFLAKECSAEGVEVFRDFVSAPNIIKRCCRDSASNFLLIATAAISLGSAGMEHSEKMELAETVPCSQSSDSTSILGLIEMDMGRKKPHVCLLFVDPRFHKKGIARQLFSRAVSETKLRRPDASVIDVHSSPFAVPVYRKLGFVETAPWTRQNGLVFAPMECRIKA